MGNLLFNRKEDHHSTFGQSAPPGSWIIRFLPPNARETFLKNRSTLPTFMWHCPEWITDQRFRELIFMVVQLYLEGDVASITKLVQQPLTAVELVGQCNTDSAGEAFVELEKELLEVAHEDIFAFVENEQLCYFDLIVTRDFDPHNELRNVLNCTKLASSQAAGHSQKSQSKYKKRKSSTFHHVPSTSTNTKRASETGQSLKDNNDQNGRCINVERGNSIPKDEKDSTTLHEQKNDEENHTKSKKQKLDGDYPIPAYAIRVMPSAPSFKFIENCDSQHDKCTNTKVNNAKSSKKESVDNHSRTNVEEGISMVIDSKESSAEQSSKKENGIGDHSHENVEEGISMVIDSKESSAEQSSKKESIDDHSHENVEGISIPKTENLSTTLIERRNEDKSKLCNNNKKDADTTVCPKSYIPPYALRIVPSTLLDSNEIGSSSRDGCKDTKGSRTEVSSKEKSNQNCDHKDHCENTSRVVGLNNELPSNYKCSEGEKHLRSTRRTSFTSFLPIHGISRNIVDPCCSKYLTEIGQQKDGEKGGKETEKKDTEPVKCPLPVFPIHGLSRCVYRSPSKSKRDSSNGKETQIDDDKSNNIVDQPKRRKTSYDDASESSTFQQEDHNVTSAPTIEKRDGNDHDSEPAKTMGGDGHSMDTVNDFLTTRVTPSDDEDSSSDIQWHDALE